MRYGLQRKVWLSAMGHSHKRIISQNGKNKSSFLIWLMKWIALSCCRVYSMLLQVLPGPEIISDQYMKKVQPRRKLFQKISSAPFLQNSDTNSSSQLFISPALFELFGRNFSHLATLAPAQPPTPHFPSSPPSLAALQLTAQLAKY